MVNAPYIRVGRLVRILRGPRANKVGVVSDIIDANRILVENPADEKMWRHVQNLKNVEPTKFLVSVNRNAGTKQIKAALEKKDVLTKWSATGQSKKIEAQKALDNSSDFERYQLRVAKRSRAHWTRKIFDEKNAKTPVTWDKLLAKKLTKAHEKTAKKFKIAKKEKKPKKK